MSDPVFDTEEPQPKRQKHIQNPCTSSQPDRSEATIYRPLDKAKREIRICDLRRATEFSDSLECSLRIAPIDETGSFVAFSYVWGTDTATETISVDGIMHSIRPNLAAGLRQFRARFPQRSHLRTRQQSHPISIWADAICIDQSSVEERNHQVILMRLIFTGCEYTFSWLGEADEDSDLAMDCIAKIASFSSEGLAHSAFIQCLTQENPFHEAGPWVAIHRLFRRVFWYRVWILQELVLPKDLIIGCGSKSLPWSIFGELENVRFSGDNMDRDGFNVRKWITHIDPDVQDKILAVSRILRNVLLNVLFMKEDQASRSPSLDMGSIMQYTLHLQATDPRDKIYGFLALTSKQRTQPDYSKTTQQVYTEFSQSILLEYGSLLAFSGISRGTKSTNLQIVPSWVADWDWISRSAETIATPWKDLELITRFVGIERYWRLRKFEFKHFPGAEVLRFRGQICHTIVRPNFYTKWLDSRCLAVTIRNMYGRFYPQWSYHNGLSEPIPKLVALYRTLTQQHSGQGRPGRHSELAAGFCYSTALRTEITNDMGTSAATISLPTLLQLFGTEFGKQPEAFSRPERYSDSYLAEEKESLHQRVFFETSAGYFGLGPPEVVDGDIICRIYGCYWPLILRKVDSHYILVGACFVLGFMGDQGLDESHSEMIEVW